MKSEVDALVAVLSDVRRTESPASFPADAQAAESAGLYSWWGDETGRSVLASALEIDLLPPLLYAGQAGATKWPSGKRPYATLRSRIGRQHIRGNARSSTFRLTLSTLVLSEFDLTAAPGGRLTPESNRVVSEWITTHLRVAIAPFADRDRLGVVESASSGGSTHLSTSTTAPRVPAARASRSSAALSRGSESSALLR